MKYLTFSANLTFTRGKKCLQSSYNALQCIEINYFGWLCSKVTVSSELSKNWNSWPPMLAMRNQKLLKSRTKFLNKNLLIVMMAFIFRILVLFGFRQDLLIIIISAVPASVILTFFHCNFHVKRLSEMIIIGAALIYCENNQLSVGLPLISFFLCFFVFGRKSIIKEES